MARQWRKADVGKCPRCGLFTLAANMAGFDEDAPQCPMCLTVKLEKPKPDWEKAKEEPQ